MSAEDCPCVVPVQTTRHSIIAINHLVYRNAIRPSLQGLVGNAQIVEYTDFGAALWPIRRRSLAALTVSRHVERAGKKYRLRLHPEDTKAGREESYDCPEILAPYIDHYLTEIRPLFPGADSNDGLWTSARGKPLCEGWLYELVGRHTKQAFGKAMCLHDFRRAAHTFQAMEAPELIGLIPGILQHASPDVGDQHYNLARSTMASRRYAVHVSKVRERLRPAWRRQQQG